MRNTDLKLHRFSDGFGFLKITWPISGHGKSPVYRTQEGINNRGGRRWRAEEGALQSECDGSLWYLQVGYSFSCYF